MGSGEAEKGVCATWSNRSVSLGDGVLGVCSKFGSSLRILNLSANALNAKHYRELRRLCPDAKIDENHLSANDVGPASMVSLGEAASSLLIGQDHAMIENLDHVGRTCPNLREIMCFVPVVPVAARRDLTEIPQPMFRAFFDVPRPKLVQLWVRIRSEPSNLAPDNLFDVLLEKVSTLEEFMYEGLVPSLHLLLSFRSANRNLRKVGLHLDFPSGTTCLCLPAQHTDVSEASILNGKRAWTSILTAVYGSGSLSEIYFSCSPRLVEKKEIRCSDFAGICRLLLSNTTLIGKCGHHYP